MILHEPHEENVEGHEKQIRLTSKGIKTAARAAFSDRHLFYRRLRTPSQDWIADAWQPDRPRDCNGAWYRSLHRNKQRTHRM